MRSGPVRVPVTALVGAVTLAIPLVLTSAVAQAEPTEAEPTTISVSSTVAGSPISADVFGANHRYDFAGRGMWDQAEQTVDPGFVSAYRASGYTTTRYPGGTVANTFHWQRAVGPQASRVDNASGGASGVPVANDFGPDEWGRFMQQQDQHGTLVVNFATGSAAEAADWVEYMNAPAGSNPRGGTAWAKLRKQNGHPAPYKVGYVEVGNEIGWGAQAYWLSAVPEDERAAAYAFGGTVSFTDQRAVRFSDRGKNAAVSDGSGGQQLYAAYPPVVSGSQVVKVGGTTWTLVPSLATAGPSDEVYAFDPTTGEIAFGDGTHGAVPPQGSVVTVSYSSGPHDGFVDFYNAIKAADPHVQVCTGLNPFQAGRIEQLLQTLGADHPYDCVATHEYGNVTDATSAQDYEQRMMNLPDVKAAHVRELQQTAREDSGRDVPVVVTEWNVFQYMKVAPDFQLALGGGLYTANSLNRWIRLGVPLADKHALVNWIYSPDNPSGAVEYGASISADPGWTLTAPALVNSMYTSLSGSSPLDTAVTGNVTRPLSDGSQLAALDVVAARATDGTIRLVVVNRDDETSVATRVEVAGASQEPADVAVSELDGQSVLSYPSPDDPHAVSIAHTTEHLVPSSFTRTFPAHSVTVIELPGEAR